MATQRPMPIRTGFRRSADGAGSLVPWRARRHQRVAAAAVLTDVLGTEPFKFNGHLRMMPGQNARSSRLPRRPGSHPGVGSSPDNIPIRSQRGPTLATKIADLVLDRFLTPRDDEGIPQNAPRIGEIGGEGRRHIRSRGAGRWRPASGARGWRTIRSRAARFPAEPERRRRDHDSMLHAAFVRRCQGGVSPSLPIRRITRISKSHSNVVRGPEGVVAVATLRSDGFFIDEGARFSRRR